MCYRILYLHAAGSQSVSSSLRSEIQPQSYAHFCGNAGADAVYSSTVGVRSPPNKVGVLGTTASKNFQFNVRKTDFTGVLWEQDATQT